MDVHLTQLSQHLEDIEDHQERQAADLEEGHCRCGTLVELVSAQSPGPFFEGFEGAPRSSAVTDLGDEVQLEATMGEMRVWANTRESKPEAGPLSSKAKALDWVACYLMHPPSPWSEDGIEASLAVFPKLL
jgi:hypothetical protein